MPGLKNRCRAWKVNDEQDRVSLEPFPSAIGRPRIAGWLMAARDRPGRVAGPTVDKPGSRIPQ